MRLAYAAVAAAVVAADQLTKLAIVRTLPEGASVPLVEGLVDIVHVRNPGAAFGLFRGATAFLVLAAAVGVGVFTLILLRRPPVVTGIAAGLVAGGALGNLLDRVFRPWPFRGTVVDFIDIGWWPAFNVADIAVTVGAGLLILTGMREGREDTGGDETAEDRGPGE
ncbi:MAG TPA: signal peptidase II [Actinomycetota bacterium]|nr:signal peptidase II [Actinomycetota bacterium]